MRTTLHRFIPVVSLGLFVLAAVLWFEPWSDRDSSASLNVSRTRESQAPGRREALAREVADAAAPGASGAQVADGDRRSANQQPEPTPVCAFEVDRPLRGVVLDPLGQPVACARVLYRPEPNQFAQAESPTALEPGFKDAYNRTSFLESGVLLDSIEALTDGAGHFQISGVSTLRGGELQFGHNLFQGQPPAQAVDVDAVEQRLVIPERPAGTPTVRWQVSDRLTGEPLYPTRVRAFLLRLPVIPQLDPGGSGLPLPRRALLEPCPRDLERGLGWVHLELWPGTWRVEVATEHSLTESFVVDVPYSGPDPAGRVELLQLLDADGWDSIETSADGEFEPRPDTASGFHLHGAERFPSRPLGETREDLAFRHTFRFGVGEVRSAYLELEIEAGSSMSYNDFFTLEYVGSGKFAFGRRVGTLFGVDWRPPMRQRFLLDLSNLQGRDGVVDLRAYLADGQLDLFLQDDTAVHDVRLFLRRD